MSSVIMLDARKRLLGIDDSTVHNVRLIRPFLVEHLGSIVEELYLHLLSFPECARLLPAQETGSLKMKQKAHWLRMFECRFDEAYAAYAVRIGQTHFERKIPPYIYLAAYNYVQCLIVARVTKLQSHRHDLTEISSSLSRVITLDIDLALSAYTRAFWQHTPEPDGGIVYV